jgi:hypothetical protein
VSRRFGPSAPTKTEPPPWRDSRGDRSRAGSSRSKLPWSGPRIASQLATAVLGSGSSPPKMQLGLRFAAAKLPGLRTGRVDGSPWSQEGHWWRSRSRTRRLSLRRPAGPLYNRTRQRGGVIAIYASRKPCVPPTKRCTGRLGSRPSACELTSVGRSKHKQE